MTQYQGQPLIYHPNAALPAEWKGSENTLWLEIIPKKFTPNTLASRGDQSTEAADNLPIYRFLLPVEWSCSLNHSWEAGDTVAGKVRDLFAGGQKALAETGQVIAGISKGIFKPEIGNLAAKNDNPLMYKDTDRRLYMFNLEFHTEGNNLQDVYEPIEDLMMMGCPEGGANEASLATGIEFPYVFRVRTITGNGIPVRMVDVKSAVMTTIQPSFKGPYRQGYPSHATVEIQFLAIQPTYRDTSFGRGSGIRNITVGLDGAGF